MKNKLYTFTRRTLWAAAVGAVCAEAFSSIWVAMTVAAVIDTLVFWAFPQGQ